LKELVGYLAVSPNIGAVGGKILDNKLCVRSGGLLLLNHVVPISHGASDEADGYWFNNRVASNVEAVSSLLMATPKGLYQKLGGVPFFKYGDAAGVAYCLRLRAAGYRVVYTPWSKIVDMEPPVIPGDIDAMLVDEFGQAARSDRYYHPFYSRDSPYTLA
jgi:GT2 family glycosyltransferase